MGTWEFIAAFALALVGGAAGAAIVNGLTERWKTKFNRKVTKEDRAEAKADKIEELERMDRELDDRVDKIEILLRSVADGQKLMMLDRILYLGKGYIAKNEVSFDDRRRLREMHDAYKALGGNGDATLIMDALDELPIKK